MTHHGRGLAHAVTPFSLMEATVLTGIMMTTVSHALMNANKDTLVRYLSDEDASVGGQGKLNASAIQTVRSPCGLMHP